ncbi:hypothetical protein GCM10023194_11470 [Planotetraspora phitsanulokensis]|uniref:Glycosyltransferase 2-like domain-containing protein n=1 Tax=Planotetraspora phitsanulokensis TaxID=575192 RepID=A0A8J3UDS1_9ACTN|nr:glycosyltransferase [Planotetraspora phitsanulokensis]GII40529.1 hypothetical protein Pph01_55320 [Planotetraspora phitsanulokensis]
MAKPEVSVILPTRDAGGWLRDALDSIDVQRFRHRVEVILVEEGARGDLADEVRVLGKPMRRAETVTAAVAGAQGRHLAFLDAGDVYVPGGLDGLMELAARHDADVVVGDMAGTAPGCAWRKELALGERVIGSVAEAPDIVCGGPASNKLFARELVATTRADLSHGVPALLALMLDARRLVLSDQICCRPARDQDAARVKAPYSGDDPSLEEDGIMARLADAEQVAGHCEGRPPEVRRALMRWVGATQLRHAEAAAATLDDAGLADFAHRTSIMFKEISPPVMTEILTEALARRGGRLDDGLRAIGTCLGEPETIRRPVARGRLRVLSGRVYLDLPDLETFGDLLRVQPLTAVVCRLRPAGHATLLRVGGQVLAPGLLATQGEVRSDLLLEVGDAVCRREVHVTRARPGFFSWSCDLPERALPYGEAGLRLVARDRFGAETGLPLSVIRDERVVADFEGRRVRLRGTPEGAGLVVTRTGPLRCAVTRARVLGAAMRGNVHR